MAPLRAGGPAPDARHIENTGTRFSAPIDGPKDGVDHIIDVFIFRLDSADCVQVPVQFRSMICAGHRNDFFHQFIALSRGDELGSLHCIDQ